jgi:hypothetical protein
MQDINRRATEEGAKLIYYKMYADDLVIITEKSSLEKILDILFDTSKLYKLRINTKKSAILSIKGRSKTENEIKNMKIRDI